MERTQDNLETVARIAAQMVSTGVGHSTEVVQIAGRIAGEVDGELTVREVCEVLENELPLVTVRNSPDGPVAYIPIEDMTAALSPSVDPDSASHHEQTPE